jgi:hypothetical protein
MTHYQNDLRTIAKVPGQRPAAEAMASTVEAEATDPVMEGDAFASGLHAAIEASGLSLYTLQQRLAARGASSSAW